MSTEQEKQGVSKENKQEQHLKASASRQSGDAPDIEAGRPAGNPAEEKMTGSESNDPQIENAASYEAQAEIEAGTEPAGGEDPVEDQGGAEREATAKSPAKTKRKKKNAPVPEPQKPVSIIHLVFDEPGGEQIRQSFDLEPDLAGELLYLEDNYSLGPVAGLEEAEGWQARKGWWQSVLGISEQEPAEVMSSDKMKLHQLLQQLEQQEDTVVWIWMGQNERDVAGYFHLISQLMAFQGRIYVLYLNNLPFIDEKGHIFYPRQLAEILPREFVKASRLARVVTLSEFELDPEEWEKLSRLPGSVRLLEGGKKLSVKEDDYYDKIILNQLGSATMKLSRLLTLLATKAKLGLPEYYIIWRIKSLIEAGQVLSQGDFDKGLKGISLKATQGQLFVELNPEQTGEGEQTQPES